MSTKIDLDALDRLYYTAKNCKSADMAAQCIIETVDTYPAIAAEIRELRNLASEQADIIASDKQVFADLMAENEALRARVSELEGLVRETRQYVGAWVGSTESCSPTKGSLLERCNAALTPPATGGQP